MNYLVAVDYAFVDRPGGSARVAWDIAQVMCERGHQVSLLAAYQSNAMDRPETSTHDGIRVVRFHRPELPAWHPGRMRHTISAGAEVARKHLAGQKWDIAHIHSPFTGAAVVAALGSEPHYVYTLHSPIVMEQEINWKSQGLVGHLKWWLATGAIKRLERGLLSKAQAIQTLSQYSRNKIEHYHGMGERVTVIPHWLRPELRRTCSKADARQQLGWPVDETIFFTVRRLAPRYGLEIAIDAIAPLAKAGRCRFMIAGGGPLHDALNARIAEHGVQERMQLMGRIPDDELILAYQAADMFILPTLALECFGLVTQEALAFGCPVIGTDAGATPEILDGLAPGLVVPAGDVTALHDKLRAFLDGTLQVPDTDYILRWINENYGQAVVVPRMVEFLESTIPAKDA
ncbi:MAG: glycosyltransferase family 4 protein [Planctomycetota bacterium]